MSDLEMVKQRDDEIIDDLAEHSGEKDGEPSSKSKGPFHESCCYDLCVIEPTGCCCGSFKQWNNVWHCVYFVLMIIFLFIAIIVPLIIHSAIDTAVYDYVVVDSKSSLTYDNWKTNRYGDGLEEGRIVYNVYLFDVQNPKEITEGAKPLVVERGPYSYDVYTEKFDISFPNGGEEILYNQWRYFVFNSERSGSLSDEDSVTMPYNAVVGFEYFLYSLPPELAQGITMAMMGIPVGQHMANLADLSILEAGVNSLSISDADRQRLMTQINATKASSAALTLGMTSFLASSNVLLAFMKLMLCQVQPDGLSPFWVTQPKKAWFGYMNDPLLSVVGMLLQQMSQMSGQPMMPFTTAVAGVATNYTSIADTRRRRTPSLYDSGQKNIKRIGTFKKYQNSSRIWNCAFPLNSQVPGGYIEGKEFPACAHFQNHWTDEQAMLAGYVKPWATDDANTFRGSDGGIYGRPVIADTLRVFLSDIFRSLYVENTGNDEFRGVKCKKYVLQDKALSSASSEPENTVYYQFGPDGLANFTQATAAPAFASRPHFLGGDPILYESIDGLRPNREIHDTYLLIHPPTGMIAQARKRLQTNVLLRSLTFPQTQGIAVTEAVGICANISMATAELAAQGLDTSSLSPRNCMTDQLTGMVACMAQPAEWNYQSGSIFFPLGWAEEMTEASQDKADSLSMADDLDDLSKAIRVWALVLAVCCFLMQIALVLYRGEEVVRYFEQIQRGVYKPAEHDDKLPALDENDDTEKVGDVVPMDDNIGTV